MIIQHNIPAMNAYRNYTNNTSALQSNLEKLSSGYKINKAGDDAAGLAVSEKMRAQITGLQVAQKNAKDGISLVQTAEGAMNEVHDMLNRMYELAELSANGTYDDEVDRVNYQKEIDSLTEEINRIADSTNFNGINLLDGSLATKTAGADSISISGSGVTVAKSAAIAGVYETGTLVPSTGMAIGDTYQATVSLSDGTAYTVNFTVQQNADDSSKYDLVAEDGSIYTMSGSISSNKVTPTSEEITNAIKSELNKTALADYYKIETVGTTSSGTTSYSFKFTALEAGTSTPTITGMDNDWTKDGTPGTSGTSGSTTLSIITTTQALDEGYELQVNTLYDGTNYDDAVFEINGQKFVVVSTISDAKTDNSETSGVDGDSWLNATSDLVDNGVTILVSQYNSQNGAQLGLKSTDKNYAQNIAKIAEVTGLNVSDAIGTEDGTTAVDTENTIYSTAGIRLTASGKTTTGGLTLQIGDTSDDFNKITVSVNDMHADAMGIGDIDISTQEGASAAMDKIKDAINYVSSTRGDLGALQNRLDHVINNLSVAEENITDAESTIRDVDVAEEMMSYTKNNILVQAAQAMLAQANQLPQGVLQLLQ